MNTSPRDDAQLPADFTIIEKIGEGGHGEVYKALFKMLDRVVAVKIIKSDGSDDMHKQIERIQREAKVLAKLNHLNIVKIFQVGICTDGKPFLVCEYLEGKTLDKILAETKILSKDRILSIFPQILNALQYAHDSKLIHRDIKPSNIMLIEDTETNTITAKLLDFGIAREIELASETSPGLTQTSLLSGTPVYMSPEQCQGKRLDWRSDLYSVACILFECIYGTVPFTGEGSLAVQYKQIHEDPARISHLVHESNSKLKDFFIQSLAKAPEKRPQSADSFKWEKKAKPGKW